MTSEIESSKENNTVKLKLAADKTFTILMKSLPLNTNKAYMELELKNSNCKLYVPFRDTQLPNVDAVRENYQKLIDLVEL
jgi:hypothetical protein